MRRHPNALIAMTYASALAACAVSTRQDPEPEGEVEVITDGPTPCDPPRNRPGETNRQLAARLKAERESPTQGEA